MEFGKLDPLKTTNVIIAIYRPPYSDANPVTNSMFIDNFTDWIGKRVMTYDNIISTGDFSLHVNEEDDPEIQVFINTITTLGFNQVVDFKIHNQGNYLDLVLAEELTKLKIANCLPGPYLSDHCTVETVLTQNREDMLRKSVTNRKLQNIDQQQFITDLKHQDLYLMQQPDKLVNTFEDQVQKALDKHASEREWEKSPSEVPIHGSLAKLRQKESSKEEEKKIWWKYVSRTLKSTSSGKKRIQNPTNPCENNQDQRKNWWLL